MEILVNLIMWLLAIGLVSIFVVLKFDKVMTIKELVRIRKNKTSRDE